jgi:hypothetical protein
VTQIEAVSLNQEEMALVIKRFKTTLKGHKDYPNKSKSRGKRTCFKFGKSGLLLNVPIMRMTRTKTRKGRRRRRSSI